MQNIDNDEIRPYNRQSGSKPPGRQPLNARSKTVQIAIKVPNKLKLEVLKQVKMIKKLGFKADESKLIRMLIELYAGDLTNIYLKNHGTTKSD